MKIIIYKFTPQCIEYEVIYRQPQELHHLLPNRRCGTKNVVIKTHTLACFNKVFIEKFQHDLDNYIIFGRKYYTLKIWSG